jgi:hypothetical protein
MACNIIFMCVGRPYLSHLILIYCCNRWISLRLNNFTNDKIAMSKWGNGVSAAIIHWTKIPLGNGQQDWNRRRPRRRFASRHERGFYDGPNLSHGLLCLMFDEAITLDLWPPITTRAILIAFFIGFTINPPWTRVFVVLFVVGLWRLFSEWTDVSN